MIRKKISNIIKIIGRKRLLAVVYFSFIILIIIILNPIKTYKDVKRYVIGHPAENTTLIEKIKNDLNIKPYRQIVKYENKSSREHKELLDQNFNPRRENPRIFLSGQAKQGYRLIHGVFDFADKMHGVILLNEKGEVKNVWQVSQEGDARAMQKDTNIFPHGIEIASDGSIVVSYSSGSTLTRYDYCGDIIWRKYGLFHHSISFDDNNKIWTWGYDKNNSKTKNSNFFFSNLMQLDFATGEILKDFNLTDVMKANPDIDIFGTLQKDNSKGSEWIESSSYYFWHPNDIEPLPKKWAENYTEFETGDLLISLRASNLIFVINPDTLKVKWWRQGLTRRQHDPDWNEYGTITIFNNNMHRDYSNITELNPETYEFNIPIKGEDYNFYTWMRGKHQMLSTKSSLITSPQQGRVFEVSETDEVTFEFLNIYNSQNNEYLAVSEAKFLPLDFFNNLPTCE